MYSLLASCGQVRNDALPILCGTNTFLFASLRVIPTDLRQFCLLKISHNADNGLKPSFADGEYKREKKIPYGSMRETSHGLMDGGLLIYERRDRESLAY